MPSLVINKQYQNGTVLTSAQLDAAFASITTLLNITGIGADNLQNNSVGSAEIQTGGVQNSNMATNSVGTTNIIDANVTKSKLDPTSVQTFLVPIGASLDYFVNTSTPPAGFLICDGTAISRSTYANLFNIVGTIYGTGDGSTTFNLPNCTDRVFRQIGTLSAESNFALNTGTANMYQDDALFNHTHPATVQGGTTAVGGASGYLAASSASNAFTQNVSVSAISAVNGSGGHTALSSTETRMKNVQGYKIIKY